MHSFQSFMQERNVNDRGILLNFQASTEEIHFLNLNIKVVDGQFTTTTYFKETDRNSYIPLSSCHHRSWPKSIPKSKFQWVHRNGTNLIDYFSQAEVLKNRFLKSGYDPSDIDVAMKQGANLDRKSILIKKTLKMRMILLTNLWYPIIPHNIIGLRTSLRNTGQF